MLKYRKLKSYKHNNFPGLESRDIHIIIMNEIMKRPPILDPQTAMGEGKDPRPRYICK